MRSPYREEWRAAEKAEIDTINSMNTWKLVVPERDSIVLPGTWDFKTKRNLQNVITRFKARWCVRGDRQKLFKQFDLTFAAVVKSTT